MGVLKISRELITRMISHALDEYPLEACGLLGGDAEVAKEVYPARNDAASARVYTLNPLDHLRADRASEAAGHGIIGVYHSHTHSEAYPSQTDVAQAPDPGWHYVLVSLKRRYPVVRSYRIEAGTIVEEDVVEL